MKLSKGTENLGLPSYMKFGLELEAENVSYSKVTEEIKSKNWKTDKDASLTDNGTECVSPVLFENEEKSVWQEVDEVCESIKRNPADISREAYTDHTCGGHVHFDATELLKNPNAMRIFLKIYAESEMLIYKICNDKNDPIRPGAIESSHTTLIDVVKTLLKSPIPKDISGKSGVQVTKDVLNNVKNNAINANKKVNVILNDILLSRNGMAAPIGNKIKKQILNGNLKLGKPKSMAYRYIFVRNKLNADRYGGLNLSNLGDKKKNTIEFRMSNGTVNPRVIKENVFLYASLIDTALRIEQEPEKYYKKLGDFCKRDVSEEEKLDNFLKLIMENEEDRQVYKERWETVKNAPVFKIKGANNFLKNTFGIEDIGKVSQNVSGRMVKEAYAFMENIKEGMKTKDNEGVLEIG